MSELSEKQKRALAIAAKLSTRPSAEGSSLVADNINAAINNNVGNSQSLQQRINLPVNRFGRNFVGLLIGPKAKTLQMLQQQTGCIIQVRGKGSKNHISLPGHPGEDVPYAFIQGSDPAKVQAAVKLIQDIINDPQKAENLRKSQMDDIDGLQAGAMGSIGTISAGATKTTVKIPNNLSGAVIGKQGEQIKRFIAETGAHIQIDNSAEAQNSNNLTRDLIVIGNKDQIDRVHRVVDRFVRKKQQQLGHRVTGAGKYIDMQGLEDGVNAGLMGSVPIGDATSFPYKVQLQVPDQKVGLIIGKNGKTINGIHSRYNCKIDIPKEHDYGNPNVRTLLLGAETEEGLDKAINDVSSIVKFNLLADQVANQYINMKAATKTQEINIKSENKREFKANPVLFPHLRTKQAQAYIHEVEQNSGCLIKIPTEEETLGLEHILITGPSRYLDYACEELEGLCKVLEGTAEDDGNLYNKNNKYTQAEWHQWREYYKQDRLELPIDTPHPLRAKNW
eukprot:maker-scaffold_7-snap-gene-5.42-mRNA-1 protein AED:0.01 eAED:0.01 QI:68/1/1/1/1/1/4/85/504